MCLKQMYSTQMYKAKRGKIKCKKSEQLITQQEEQENGNRAVRAVRTKEHGE